MADALEPIRRAFRNAGLYHHADDDLLCGELLRARIDAGPHYFDGVNPPAPVAAPPAALAVPAALIEAARAVLARDMRNTCQHESTHRGGFLWEICDDCGAKWADDEGGKPEWRDPPEWAVLEAAIAAAMQAQPPAAAVPEGYAAAIKAVQEMMPPRDFRPSAQVWLTGNQVNELHARLDAAAMLAAAERKGGES